MPCPPAVHPRPALPLLLQLALEGLDVLDGLQDHLQLAQAALHLQQGPQLVQLSRRQLLRGEVLQLRELHRLSDKSHCGGAGVVAAAVGDRLIAPVLLTPLLYPLCEGVKCEYEQEAPPELATVWHSPLAGG